MSKENKNASSTNATTTTTASKPAAKVAKKGPGRPKYVPSLPTKKNWTFTDFEVANGVNPDTGKGDRCTTLTLRNWLSGDMYIPVKNSSPRVNPKSLVVRAKDANGDFMLAEPTAGKLGRKQLVYTKRVGAIAPKATKTPKATKDSTPKSAPATDLSPETQDYEATKAALLGTSVPLGDAAPAPTPEVTPTPEVAAPAAEAAPVESVAVAS